MHFFPGAASGSSVLDLVLTAGPVGKTVLAFLLGLSVICWGVILERYFTFRRAARENAAFLKNFHSKTSLAKLRDLAGGVKGSPVVALFKAAFHEVSQFSVDGVSPGRAFDEDAVEDVRRMMARTAASTLRDLERSLTLLATTASASPFIGLFGTVWGIMDAFRRIGLSGAASIEAFAPGIAEALITTAAGLVAAVPAVIAYNSFVRQVRVMGIEMDDFQLEFIHLLEKQRRRTA